MRRNRERSQLTLFGMEPANDNARREPTAPYVPGSETSEAAARSLSPGQLNRLEAKVLAVIRDAGRHGATDDEIEQVTGLRHQTASARRRALVQRGWIRDSGRKRPTRSLRKAKVWILSLHEAA